MYDRLKGSLVIKAPPIVVLDCHGVGYEVNVSMTTFYDLPDVGSQVLLLTHFVVREDAHILFGFLSEDERSTFRQLIKISGVGARTALSILSGMSAEELRRAVAEQQSSRLIKVPGIGKKTAERLLLELKGVWSGQVGISRDGARVPNVHNDIVQALLALGYGDKEIQLALPHIPTGGSTSEGIRAALAYLAKR